MNREPTLMQRLYNDECYMAVVRLVHYKDFFTGIF